MCKFDLFAIVYDEDCFRVGFDGFGVNQSKPFLFLFLKLTKIILLHG